MQLKEEVLYPPELNVSESEKFVRGPVVVCLCDTAISCSTITLDSADVSRLFVLLFSFL